MKWEPLAAMVALLLLGMWLVSDRGRPPGVPEDARIVSYQFGNTKGAIEVIEGDAAGPRYRLYSKDGGSWRSKWIAKEGAPVVTGDQLSALLPAGVVREITQQSSNALFRLLHITSWAGAIWVAVGFAGQFAFMGRMLLQWFVSEKEGKSVVPEAFWWMSLIGGAMSFAYFVWRQDLVAVLGQTSGVVIYARNIRLIHKKRRRAARVAAAGDPNPVLAPGS